MKADNKLALPLPRPAEHVWRVAAAKVRGFIAGLPVDAVLERDYPDDPVAPLILRAATDPAKMSVPAWAGALAAHSVSSAIQEAVSMSMLRELLARGALRVDLGRLGSVVVPGRSTTPADGGVWVGEGEPIPVREYTILGPTLRPHKVAVIVTFSRELSEASNIEEVLRALITEAAGPAMDVAILSTTAATATTPGGILAGLTPVAAAPSGAAYDNCAADLGALVGDLAARNGGANALIVAAPAQATAIKFFSSDFAAVGSAGLADGTVVAIEPSSFAITAGTPEFEVGTVAALHMEDTAPLDIAATAGPTLATPVKSLWQTDAIGLKMTFRADWAMRAPHVAYMESVSW